MRIPRRYRFTAYVGLCALVSAAVLVSLNPVARGVFETPDRADVPLLQQTETAPIHLIPAQERAEVSADIFHPTYYYTGYGYFLGRAHGANTAAFDLAVNDLPLANLQGIANATPAAAGELTGKANLNLSVQNAQPAGDAIERLKPVEASIGGVQLRMLGASNPAADALDTTPGALPSVTVPSVSGTSGLLRR